MCRAEGDKGEKKWDNCNSIINKIHFKNQLKYFPIKKISKFKSKMIDTYVFYIGKYRIVNSQQLTQ